MWQLEILYVAFLYKYGRWGAKKEDFGKFLEDYLEDFLKVLAEGWRAVSGVSVLSDLLVTFLAMFLILPSMNTMFFLLVFPFKEIIHLSYILEIA